ncbi:MAG: hypothetical protein IIX19_01635 [Alistipes sp.]|nr:hypothetical protein [Alistipes sp.]
MKNLFTLKKELWHTITSSDPTLLFESTLQKLMALTDYLDNEISEEYKLPSELTAEIRLHFAKRVWHYSADENFELSIELMLELLVDSIADECRYYGYSDAYIESMSGRIKEVMTSFPEFFAIHETKIRAIVIRSYLIEQLEAKGCPEEVVCQLVPSYQDIVNRLFLDILEC